MSPLSLTYHTAAVYFAWTRSPKQICNECLEFREWSSYYRGPLPVFLQQLRTLSEASAPPTTVCRTAGAVTTELISGPCRFFAFETIISFSGADNSSRPASKSSEIASRYEGDSAKRCTLSGADLNTPRMERGPRTPLGLHDVRSCHHSAFSAGAFFPLARAISNPRVRLQMLLRTAQSGKPLR